MTASTKRLEGPGLRIACLNVKYSPNLGDGLLSECLERALIDCGADPRTGSVDLAGRNGYGDAMAGRGAAMAVLEALPPLLRQRAVRLPLRMKARSSWGPHYRAGLEGADAAVIGGGNLLSDHDLNFPTKIALALAECARRGLPSVIYACGMGERWSAEGHRRMQVALEAAPPRAVFLRDAASAARWDARFGEISGTKAEVVRDPGLLACDTYEAAERPAGERPRIGLGIMSHIALRYHSASGLSQAELGRWYLELARALVDRGARVMAFTNGSPEDIAAAEALRPDLTSLPGGIALHRPETPADLARLLSGCDAIAAFRMHALIAAHSFGVPGLALTWDDKLDAFMQSVGREAWLQDAAQLPAGVAADLLLKAAGEGLPEAERRAVVAETRRDVGRLYATLQEATLDRGADSGAEAVSAAS